MKDSIKAFIAQKAFNKWVEKTQLCTPVELRERIEDCLFAYGTIITKDGRVLTLEEVENINF